MRLAVAVTYSSITVTVAIMVTVAVLAARAWSVMVTALEPEGRGHEVMVVVS